MITINLDDLTQTHIDECAPKLGDCTYSAPCIIGTLVPPAERKRLGAFRLGRLIAADSVSVSRDQLDEANRLQMAFDTGDTGALTHLLAKRGLVWPTN